MKNKNIDISIENLTKEILQLKINMTSNMLKIGEKLIEIKQFLPHGEFSEYLKNKVDFTQRTAQRYMKAYTDFSNDKRIVELEPSKLIILLDIPKKYRNEFMKDNDLKNMSCREIRKKIVKFKNYKNIKYDLFENGNKRRKIIPQTTIKHLINRNNGKCEICGWGGIGLEGVLTPHHIHRYSDTEDNSIDNLILICPNCHGLIHMLGNCKDETIKENVLKNINNNIIKNKIIEFTQKLGKGI